MTDMYRLRDIDGTERHVSGIPSGGALGWFTTNVTAATGYVAVSDDDPDDAAPVAAWLTQELRFFGGGADEIFDTRVVAAVPDDTAEMYLSVTDERMRAGLMVVPPGDRVVHESRLAEHVAHLRRRGIQ